MIEAHFNGFHTHNYWHEHPEDVRKLLPEGSIDHVQEDICIVMSKYKYLILIDGHVSTWARSS